MRWLTRAVAFLGSFGLAVVLLVLLLLLTLFGTLEQVTDGIYAVQQKYFNSLLVVHRIGGVVPFPLPGGYLLMAVLAVNLFVGAIVRAPKRLAQPGILIAHAGVFVLLAAGFVTHHFSDNGSMQLYEGQASNLFRSYHDWVVEIQELREGELTPVYVVHPRVLRRAVAPRAIRNAALPFALTLSGYLENAQPVASGPEGRDIVLQPLPLHKEAERNVAGVYARITPEASDAEQGAILWGLERQPHIFTSGGRRWRIGMARKSWVLPFTVRLDTFTMERHPNTAMPRRFESEITRIEGETQARARIYMNHPLRHKGYTLFQASWGPQDAGPNTPLFTGLAVVRNPADHWPLYACIIMSVGMLIHFLQRLVAYLKEQSR